MMNDNGRIDAADLEIEPASLANLARGVNGGLSALEQTAIEQALDQTGGNRTQAAGLLGISRRTLLRRLKTYEAEREQTSTAC